MAQGAVQCEEDIFCGINTAKDSNNMTDLEKKHLPVISAPEKVRAGEPFEVMVEVGKLKEHPLEPGHHVEFVELYAGHTYLGRMDFAGNMTYPTMRAVISLDHGHGSLRAFEHCNLHGTWQYEAPIEVTE